MKLYFFRLGYRFFKRRPLLLLCSCALLLALGYQFSHLHQLPKPGKDPYWLNSPAKIIKIRWQEKHQMGLVLALAHPKIRVLATLKTQGIAYQIGDQLHIKGLLSPFEEATNPYQFNWRRYYQRKGILGRIAKVSVLAHQSEAHFSVARSIQAFRQRLILQFQKLFPSPYDTRIYALVFGVEGIRLDDQWQSLMQQMGLIHAIVVSGSQVALLSGFIWLFLRLLGLPFRIRWLLMAAIHAFFFIVVGGGPAVMRSMLMMHVLCLLQALQRQSNAWRLLAVVAILMLLLVGHYFFELGFWLSFIATFSLMIWVPAVEDKWLLFIKKPLRVFLLSTLLPSFSTALFLVLFKHTLQPWSFVANLLLIPVFEWMVLLGFLLPFFAFLGLGLPIAWLLLGLVYACEGVVTLLSMLPFNQVSVSLAIFLAFVLPALVLYGLLPLAVSKSSQILLPHWPGLNSFCTFLMSAMPKLRVYGCVLAAFLGLLIYQTFPKNLEINMMDVGQGDCFVILTPQRKAWLIDVGYGRYKASSFDKSVSVLVPYLRARGIQSIEGLILSHLDADHAGGIHSLVATFPVKNIYVSSQAESQKLIHSLQMPIQHLFQGQRLSLAHKLSLTVLGPAQHPPIKKKNNRSLLLKLNYHHFDALFMGDAHASIEKQMLHNPHLLKNIEVLKVGHHGSKTSSNASFLAAIKAQVSLISVGRNNRYGHPHADVLQRLKLFSDSIFRTDLNGFVQIKSNGFAWRVQAFQH